MPEIPTTLELAARAVLSRPWGSGPWSAHSEHRFDIECAVCQGDVRRVLAVALTTAADHAHQLASSHASEHDALRQRYADALSRSLTSPQRGMADHLDAVLAVRDDELAAARVRGDVAEVVAADTRRRAEQAEAANARIRGLHRNEYGCCVECMKPSAASVPWPCPTIRALDGTGGVSEQTETAATVDQRARDVAFNAVQPALAQTGDWLRLTARRNVADAVLAALAEHGRLVFTAEAEQTGGGNV